MSRQVSMLDWLRVYVIHGCSCLHGLLSLSKMDRNCLFLHWRYCKAQGVIHLETSHIKVVKIKASSRLESLENILILFKALSLSEHLGHRDI